MALPSRCSRAPARRDQQNESQLAADQTDRRGSQFEGAMSGAGIYQACPIKRARRTKQDIDSIRTAIINVLKADNPQTVRQIFYQLVVRGVIEKTEAEYQTTVIRLLSEMRLSGDVPFSWIVDESRRTRQTRTFDNVTDALNDTAKFYRRSALRESDVYIEFWSEKEALSGIIWDVASDYDVPVIVSKGTPSLTQLYGSFAHIWQAARAERLAYLYQFGDHDPSGCLIPRIIEARLNEFCDKHECRRPTIERVALTPEQIRRYRLPTRPTKRDGNSHAKGFKGRSTELDALPPNVLRQLVRNCIERHITADQVAVLRAAEDSERAIIEKFARRAAKAGAQ
jgi:hypothetical protein